MSTEPTATATQEISIRVVPEEDLERARDVVRAAFAQFLERPVAVENELLLHAPPVARVRSLDPASERLSGVVRSKRALGDSEACLRDILAQRRGPTN